MIIGKEITAMDRLGYLKFALIVALAITAYLLLLQWQQDYVSAPQNLTVDDVRNPPNEQYPSDPQVFSPANLSGLQADSNGVIKHTEGMVQSDLPVIKASVAKASANSAMTGGLAQNPVLQIKTDVLELDIDLAGGDIVSSKLLSYPKELDDETPFTLLNAGNPYYIAQSGVIGERTSKDLDQTGRPIFTAEQLTYQLSEGQEQLSVPIYYENAQLSVVKRFIIQPGQYQMRIETQVTNKADTVWAGRFFGQIQRDKSEDPSANQGGFGLPTYLGAAFWSPEKRYNKLEFEDFEDARETRTALALDQKFSGGWIAWVQHYFISAWIPEPGVEHHFNARMVNQDKYAISFTDSKSTQIQPGQSAVFSAQFYVGPKIEKQLEQLADGLNLAVDYGFLFMISKLLFVALSFIEAYVGNWGVAIILLTMFIKALFVYPSAISYRSMAKMRKLQPHLTRLKDQHGQDRQKMSQEMIKLYQKEKVNPFGGCLPVLMQMPVFIALYWALLESVELRQAPFFLWINDLSAMDPYFILPLLMGVSMFVQTSLNPTPPDPTQAKVMKLMPIIFTVFFLFFPAGLVLYWLTNNILSILQQWYITRQIEGSYST